jgi:hypothetical protein
LDYHAAMTQFFTVNSAAEVLERDRRTIGRALRGVPPDHKDKQGHSLWRLPVILDALSASHGGGASAAVTDEILAASEAVEKLLDKLHTAADENVEQARALLRSEGHHIGALDHALECGLAGLQPGEVGVLKIVRDYVIGAATGEALQLCDWQLAESGGST